MKLYTTTGKTLNNDYRGTALQSCKPTDYVTKDRVFVDYGGKVYERAIHERAIYRAMKPNTILSRYVIIDGQFLVVEETNFVIEFMDDFTEPTWVCYERVDGEWVDGVAGYDSPMEAWEGMKEEIELTSSLPFIRRRELLDAVRLELTGLTHEEYEEYSMGYDHDKQLDRLTTLATRAAMREFNKYKED